MTATPFLEDERTAMLRAVLADPANDLPRLVFADWLDDHGEPERAEFIRVQIDRWPRVRDGLGCETWTDGPCGECGHCRLGRRERELWTGGGAGLLDTFIGELRPPGVSVTLYDQIATGPGAWAVVRRGFVGEVRLPLARFVGGGPWPCGRCEGLGSVIGPIPGDTCPTCCGTGTTPGVARGLFARHPVTAVVLTDREPAAPVGRRHEGRFGWYCRQVDDPEDIAAGNTEADELPPEIWIHLVGPPLETDRGEPWAWKLYDTRAAALAALSAACVAYGRRLVGLE